MGTVSRQAVSRAARQFEVAAIAPPGPPDPAIAIAASRAGGLGLLDLTAAVGPAAAAVRRLADLAAPGRWGVKLDGTDADVARLARDAPWALIEPCVRAADLAAIAAELRAAGVTVLFEAIDVDEAAQAEALACDGIVAKGSESGGRVGDETAFVLLQRILQVSRRPVWVHGGIGPATAAAARAAGAAGAVIDAQLCLTPE